MAEKEYIERGALIAEMDCNAPENWTNSDAEIQEEWDYHRYRDMILSQPTADVVEVKHGYWNYDGSCGVCKKQILSNYMNYCPHCGAKMKGGAG